MLDGWIENGVDLNAMQNDETTTRWPTASVRLSIELNNRYINSHHVVAVDNIQKQWH